MTYARASSVTPVSPAAFGVPAEAGMGGQQHPGVAALGEQIGEPGHGHRAASAVHEQERPGAVAVGDGDLHWAA